MADGTYVVRVGDEAGHVDEIYFRVGSTQPPVQQGPKVTFMNGTTMVATVDTVDGKATLPATNPTLDAYTFVEWVDENDTTFTADTVVETDTTVYPKFESNFIIGDVNADGVVSVSDSAVITKRLIGGETEFTDEDGNAFKLGESFTIINK